MDLINDVSIMTKPSFTSYTSSSWAWIAAAALVFCCAHSIYVTITCWCARMASSGGQDRQSAADWPFPAVSAGSLLAPRRWLHVCFAAAPPCARARCCFHSTATRTAVNARAHCGCTLPSPAANGRSCSRLTHCRRVFLCFSGRFLAQPCLIWR